MYKKQGAGINQKPVESIFPDGGCAIHFVPLNRFEEFEDIFFYEGGEK